MNLSTFLSGVHVDLVAPDLVSEVIDSWYRWFNDEQTTRFMQKHFYPNTAEEQANYIRTEILGNPRRLQLGIVAKPEQKLIGMISLSQIDNKNHQAEIGGLIGDKEFRNGLYWLEANNMLLKHAHDELNLSRIYGGSLSEDVALFYERLLGFKREGTLRAAVWKAGRYWNCYQFSKLFDSREDRIA